MNCVYRVALILIKLTRLQQQRQFQSKCRANYNSIQLDQSHWLQTNKTATQIQEINCVNALNLLLTF